MSLVFRTDLPFPMTKEGCKQIISEKTDYAAVRIMHYELMRKTFSDQKYFTLKSYR